jgi:DNA polymerase-3 subunit epsilon
MKLKLDRPIAFFDLETTGIDPVKDRIVEISILKIFPNGNKESKTRRVNPEMDIPKQSSDIHGITFEDIKDEPTLLDLAAEIALFIKDTDLGGYNCNRFDIPLLVEEFLRIGVDLNIKDRKVIDVQVIFHKMELRTLGAAYKFYCGKELEGAHGAEADIKATYDVLLGQLDKYSNLKNDISFLDEYTTRSKNADYMGRIVFNEKNEECINFGKHKGKTVKQVLEQEPSYYKWMMNGDFPRYTKQVLTSIKNKMNK